MRTIQAFSSSGFRRVASALLAAVLLVAVASPLAADARPRHRRHHHARKHHRRQHPSHPAQLIRWGSSLSGQPTETIPGKYTQDAEFWMEALGSATAPGVQATVTAPISGQIKAVLLKVGDATDDVPIRFSVVEPLGNGDTKVLTTSTPHLMLPAHSPGVHTFDFSQLQFGMPINKGDYLTIDTPGIWPYDMNWYAPAAGAASAVYTSHGPTQSPGYVRTADVHPGLELLMQVVEQPGRSYHFHLPAGS